MNETYPVTIIKDNTEHATNAPNPDTKVVSPPPSYFDKSTY